MPKQKTPLTKLYSNFSVINGNCSFALALASDLTVPFPTPQKRQQVCRTPRKHPVAALSDVAFRAVVISRRNSRRGMFRADAQHDPCWVQDFVFRGRHE